MMSLITLRILCKPKHFSLVKFRQYASAEESKAEAAEPDGVKLLDLVEESPEEDVIEKLRHKSNLGPKHYRKFHDKHQLISEDEKVVFAIGRLRRMYGQHGSRSGINVGVLWPSKEELELRREWEALSYPHNLSQMMEISKQLKLEEEQQILKRQEELTRKVAKLEQWKKEVRDNIAKQERIAREAKEKKERLLEEVRQMFGFRIDPKDAKFQEALEKKELEDKKAAKAAKKLKKQQKIIENIKKLAQQETTQENTSSEKVQNTDTVPEANSPPIPKS